METTSSNDWGQPDPQDTVFVFHGRLLVLSPSKRIPTKKELPELVSLEQPWLFTGQEPALASRIWCGEWQTGTEEAEALAQQLGLTLLDFREAFAQMTDAERSHASRAFQLGQWQRKHRFCGQCGRPTIKVETLYSRRCEPCKLDFFPRISPAVIVLIHREDAILLAHNAKSPEGVYSLVAGFVEVGESLEEAVVREIHEEVGIEVERPQYITSQGWPFPDNLMLGFFARYKGGEIRPDGAEITSAHWFTQDNLPHLPRRGSIAHSLIEQFYQKEIP